MIVTFRIAANGSVRAEGAGGLSPVERLQLVQAIIGERKRRGEGRGLSHAPGVGAK